MDFCIPDVLHVVIFFVDGLFIAQFINAQHFRDIFLVDALRICQPTALFYSLLLLTESNIFFLL